MTATQQQTEPSASQSSAELSLVLRHPEDAHHLSDQEVDWILLSLRNDPRVSLGSILEDIAAEEAQLWSVQDGEEALLLLVTRIVAYERCDAFEIQLCGGKRLQECLRLLPLLEEHAKNLGCQLIELKGRPGWQRVLPQYRVRAIALEKEL